MKRKLKQRWSKTSPISTKRTITSRLNSLCTQKGEKTTCDVGNPGPAWDMHKKKVAAVKPINRITTLSS